MAHWSERFVFRGVMYVSKWIRCGKEACSKCPHGPYWYAEMTISGGRKVSRYVGKELKGPALQHYIDKYRGGLPNDTQR